MGFADRLTTGLLLSLVLAGCGGTPSTPEVANGPTEEVPEEAQARFAEAVQLVMQQRDEEAAVLLELLAETYPGYAGPKVNLGLIHQRAGRAEAAEQAFLQALQRDPGHAVAHAQLGILYRQRGRFEEAAAAYERALARDPDYALAHLNYGVLLDLYLHRPEEALAHYERYEALTPAGVASDAPEIAKWIAELRRRIESSEITARAQR